MASSDRTDPPSAGKPAEGRKEPAPVPRRGEEPFLARWSRLKRESRAAQGSPGGPERKPADDPPPPLPPLESLSFDSDFRAFMHPKVEDGLRRAALKKLFSDPHFNVMDGLDVYIDDYNKFEPLEPELLARLTHTVEHLLQSRSREEEAPQGPALAQAGEGLPPPGQEPPAAPEPSETRGEGAPAAPDTPSPDQAEPRNPDARA